MKPYAYIREVKSELKNLHEQANKEIRHIHEYYQSGGNNTNANIPGPSTNMTGNNTQSMQPEKEGSVLDQELSFLSNENAELKKALAAAQAKANKLQEQGDDDENKITDISTLKLN